MHYKYRMRGFTLIELLVVIAIIAILAAILFPVFIEARNAAKQASCASQLKEIGSAVRMYADDYNDCLPLHFSYYTKVDETDPMRQHVSYYDVLPPYFKKKWGSFICPADLTGCVAWEQWHLGQRGLVPNRPTYYAAITGYATWLYPPQAGTPNPSAWKFPKISEIAKKPSRMAYMWEGYHDFVDSPMTQLFPGTYKWDNTRRIAARHNNGMNCLFFDWHVKWMKHTMITPEWLGWK